MCDEEHKPIALIMKGGGVKGLAYVGALEELNRKHTFNWFVGTSAGAIAAVLLGAGYTLDELKKVLEGKDFREFFDASWPKAMWNLQVHGGLFRADAFKSWIEELLARKLKQATQVKLKNLRHRVTIYASRRNQTAQKFDSVENGDVSAAYAVRCSMSIPLVFIPESTEGFKTFDGGVQNNYPVRAFLEDYPGTPFIGLYLGPQTYESSKQPWFVDVYYTLTEAADVESLAEHSSRTVVIDPRPIGTLDFGLSADEKNYLIASGREAALALLDPNGPDHSTALIERDRLRGVVDTQRKTAARRKQWGCLSILGLIFALVIGLVCIGLLGWYWWNLPKTSPIQFPQFIQDFEAKRDDQAKLADFERAYVDRQVTWEAIVVEVKPHAVSPALEIAPVGMDPDVYHVRATFKPEDFEDAKALEVSAKPKVKIRGLVSEATGPTGAHLKDCEILQRVE
jgi:predicted acylesterase/phospholipase RssA